MKRFVCMALVLLMVFSFAVSARAVSTEKGSVEVKVEYNGIKITGGDLIAVQVGYPDDRNAVFRNVANDDAITSINGASAVTQMQNFYTAYKNSHTFRVFETDIEEGLAEFSNLPLGLYLIYQETPAVGYEKLTAFLVTVPYNGDTAVSVLSKTELDREPAPTTEPTTEPTTDPTTDPTSEPTTDPTTDPTSEPTTDPTTESTTTSTTSPGGGGGGGSKLPQTGQLTWPIPWMAASGMLLFVLGWVLCFSKREDM